ncbi:MAG: HNH endonuclease [Pyrinomonadaceae bacterium]|nr:HNH endonuclease [Pyrinomonadaceae bacterium]
MKLWVGITDDNWFKLLAAKDFVEEVNFWRPTHRPYRKDFEPGMPFLFKLHAPDNYIVGGGFFLKFLSLPLSLAWDSFGEGNGARSLEEFRTLIGSYRPIAMTEDPLIGCTILSEPFFFDKPEWIPSAPYLKGPIVAGKGNFESSVALALWQGVASRLAAGAVRSSVRAPGPATIAAQESARYGTPTLVAPRLGQGSFRAIITDTYRYRCAISSERTLPVLQAAHIRPYAEGGQHELSNGLLLRSDLHTLFDKHYLTIEPTQKTIIVSRRIREQFTNGRDYYALNNHPIAQPADALALPSTENLAYHFDRFRELENG